MSTTADDKTTDSQAATSQPSRPSTEKADPEAQNKPEEVTSNKIATKKFPVTDLDSGLVGWDSQDDPANPQNFPPRLKWTILGGISVMTIISPLASNMFAPSVSYMAEDLDETNETLVTFSVTIYVLAYAIGPLILGPLSELYGRRIVLSCANWFFVLWQIGCALAQNIETLVICRFLAGIGGSGCLTLGAGVIADMFPIEQRGKAASIWAMGPLIGPMIGPIAGGFLGEAVGWRWVFWVLLIAGGVLSLLLELVMRETYAPELLKRKAKRLAKELNRPELRSATSIARKETSVSATLRRGMLLPFVLLFKSVIIFLLSTYVALIYGLLYLLFTSMPTVFINQYGFSTGLSGLAYIGIGSGFLFGLLIIGLTSDKTVVKMTARNRGKFEPEMRLPFMAFFACILPITFFWYGWSAEKQVHWIVPIIGMFPFGVAMMGVFMPTQTYVIDCYPTYAASASAALAASRSLLGGLLPLVGPALFDALGIGWGNSLLGFLALAFVPLPLIFTKYGKAIRLRYPLHLDE